VDIISVDSHAAGCISTFIGSSGRLDPERLFILKGCRDDLARVLPVLDGESKAYVERLHRLTVLVLAALKQR